MAFIIAGGVVVSYAEATDVRDKDQRLFEANEINFADAPNTPTSVDEYLEDLNIKSTNRINQKIRASARWREYLGHVGGGFDQNSIPAFNPTSIIDRKADFTDMCSYYTLKEYLLPKIADFGNPESPEVQKIQYYDDKFNELFSELLNMFDWYSYDGDASVEDGEKMIRFSLTRRTRGRRSTTRVR